MADSVEVVQQRLLNEIPDDIDKSEGEFVYDVTKPVAIELSKQYLEQDKILDRGFVETAAGTDLDRKVSEQGLTRKPATFATATVKITGAEGAEVNEGILVSSDTINFRVTESVVIDSSLEVNVSVECIQSGIAGNVPAGAIKYFPVTIAGLTSVTNLEAVNNGYNAESDEELRQRYYDKVRTPATSGNKYHYKNWAKEVTGVGDARVISLWDGPGTVKVIIIDSNKTGADLQLIEDVENYIEEVRPIGATVTVVSASEVAINVQANLTIDIDNYSEAEVIENIEEGITEYLKEIAFIEDYVSYARIGSIILGSQGVLDYESLTVNSGTANISIANDEVAVLGGVVNV